MVKPENFTEMGATIAKKLFGDKGLAGRDVEAHVSCMGNELRRGSSTTHAAEKASACSGRNDRFVSWRASAVSVALVLTLSIGSSADAQTSSPASRRTAAGSGGTSSGGTRFRAGAAGRLLRATGSPGANRVGARRRRRTSQWMEARRCSRRCARCWRRDLKRRSVRMGGRRFGRRFANEWNMRRGRRWRRCASFTRSTR